MKGQRAVIFDMDGVIVDSEPLHEKAFLEVVEALGYGESHGLIYADYVGRPDRDMWEDFIARNNPAQGMEELLSLKHERLAQIIRRDQPVFTGLPELLNKLAGKYALALASGSERCIVEEVLALKGLRSFFPVTVSASEVPRGKPAPDIFLRTAELLGLAPGDCCVIEDSKPGIAAGIAAGMRVIAITNTHPASELSHAERVVSKYEEIERLLL